jgi:CRP-like cAMP-binding protein
MIAGGGILDTLNESDRRALWASMRRRKFAKGEVLFHEGDPADSLHVIVKGHVAVQMTTEKGDTVILRVLGRDDLVGEFALLSPAPRAATVVALDPTETMLLHRDAFARLRREKPDLDAFLLDAAIVEVRRLSAALLDALHTPAETRVLRRLAEVARLYPPGEPLPFSQQDIAQLAGVTRQSANKVLSKAQERGLVRLGRGNIEIRDLEALARHAR